LIRLLLTLSIILLPTLAAAQEGTTRLSRLLESQLSDGEDRQVSITGFEGALSSEASLDRLTVADADGVWLVLDGVILDWNRSALLRGSLQVTSLTAERLEIIRSPNAPEGVDLPDAEATPFALPDLPVRVNIEEFAIAEVVLGEPIIGIAASLSIQGNLLLDGGAGNADITLDRLDGPTGQFALQASYDNTDRDLSVALLLEEASGGLAAELLGLPGRPSIRLGV
jgi:translocation and assembly module TamB